MVTGQCLRVPAPLLAQAVRDFEKVVGFWSALECEFQPWKIGGTREFHSISRFGTGLLVKTSFDFLLPRYRNGDLLFEEGCSCSFVPSRLFNGLNPEQMLVDCQSNPCGRQHQVHVVHVNLSF